VIKQVEFNSRRENEMEIIHSRDNYDSKRRTLAQLIVFIKEERPIDKGDILGDFVWRRKVNYSSLAKNQELKNLIAQYLQVSVEEVKLKFSRNAGCSMCPCSPGLFAYTNKPRYMYDRLPSISVKV